MSLMSAIPFLGIFVDPDEEDDLLLDHSDLHRDDLANLRSYHWDQQTKDLRII